MTVGPPEQKSHGHDPEWAITSQVDAQSTDAGTTRIALWLLLSFTGSVFFLATTNHLSQDVAAVPFLWALPLATYLLTFIICFDRPRWYSRRWMAIAAALASVTVPTVISNTGVPMQVAAYGAFVFCFCMLCHGELVHVRPGARYLTLFYLLVALGGALGGTFVSIVAPAVFDDIWEFQGAIVAGWIIVAMAWWKDRSSPFHDGDRWLFGSLVAFGSFLVLQYVIERTSIGQVAWVFQYRSATIFAAVALSTLCCCSLVWKRGVARVAYWPQAFVVLAIIASTMSLLDRVSRARSGTLYAARDFYGVVRVVGTETSEGDMRRLLHGTTTHGVQVNTPRYRRTATAYYTPSTGIAAAIERLLRRDPVTGADRSAGIHIGVVGMGVGTISALARAGDRVRYYEINPEVIKIVQGVTAYFTFIGDSAAEAEIITGDARLELERELSTGRPQQFDVLAMDAFSSDSVPVHLVTLEAFRVYAAHLRSHDSILAVNVTNRFLDLEPVVAANAEQLGFPGVRVDTSGERPAVFSSSWILMARNPLILAGASHPHSRVTPLRHKVVPFTDRYSNLFRVLR